MPFFRITTESRVWADSEEIAGSVMREKLRVVKASQAQCEVIEDHDELIELYHFAEARDAA